MRLALRFRIDEGGGSQSFCKTGVAVSFNIFKSSSNVRSQRRTNSEINGVSTARRVIGLPVKLHRSPSGSRDHLPLLL